LKIDKLLAGTLAIVLISGLGTPAFAGIVIVEPGGETITFNFEMTVTEVNPLIIDFGLSTQQVEVGDLITGTYTFDADTPDLDGSPDFGIYFHDQVRINVDGTIFESPFPFSDVIVVADDVGFDFYLVEQFNLQNSDNEDLNAFFFFELDDFDETVFDDDSLPLTPPDLSEFENNFAVVEIFEGEFSNGSPTSLFFSPEDFVQQQVEGIQFIGQITSLTLQVDPPVGGELIPIETTSLLLASAQSFSWMIPLVLSVLGIGLFVVSRKSENT